jgi:hypothetical protein
VDISVLQPGLQDGAAALRQGAALALPPAEAVVDLPWRAAAAVELQRHAAAVDEARRIAINIANLPDLLKRPQH